MNQEELFQAYLSICNKALKENKDRFPFSHVLQAAKSQSHSSSTNVRIIDDLNAQSLRFSVNEHELMQCQNSCEDCSKACHTQDKTWTVKTSYLNSVIENPDEFIKNPAKLDWEWMIDTQ